MSVGKHAREFLRSHPSAQQTRTPTEARLALVANTIELNGASPLVDFVSDELVGTGARQTWIRRYAGEIVDQYIVYIHGGGFVIGDLETSDGVCRRLALATGNTVLSVAYRCAPEYPFPAAVEDVNTVLVWLEHETSVQRESAMRICLVGDSAGGNLAVVAALRAAERGQEIDRLALIYPWVDLRDDHRSSASSFGNGFGLDAETLQWYRNCYTPDPQLRNLPEVSPILASLSGLPPTVVITAECDPLRDQGEEFAQSLINAGNSAVCTRYLVIRNC